VAGHQPAVLQQRPIQTDYGRGADDLAAVDHPHRFEWYPPDHSGFVDIRPGVGEVGAVGEIDVLGSSAANGSYTTRGSA